MADDGAQSLPGLELESFWGQTRVRVDEWRLHEAWYDAQPWTRRRGGPLPRRRALRGMVDPLHFRIQPYGLFPRGMHRSLFGSFVLHVLAHHDLVQVSGPDGFARLDEEAAGRLLLTDPFPPSEVHDAIAADPVGSLEDRVLNGIHPFALRRTSPTEAELSVDWTGSTMESAERGSGRRRYLPNVGASFDLGPDGPALRSIAIAFPHVAAITRVTRDSPPELLRQGVAILRSALVLAGEIDVHLMCHVLAEHVQLALRALPDGDPVRALLGPHVDGADVINCVGDWLILGEQGVVCATTPLTAADLARRTADALRASLQGWDTFAPRAPLGPSDRYARAANVFWDALEGYVSAAIPTYDREVAQTLEAELHALEVADWTVTVPPIADLAGLRRFCRYVVFHATFLHGWVNDAQWDDGGDPDHTPLSVRSPPDPAATYDAWRAGQARVPRVDVAYQKIIANALTRFDVGLATRDDLLPRSPPGFADLVRGLGPPFVDAGGADQRLVRDWIRSRLNS
ncbi:MAG: hypothetical protein R3F59_12605 [Myxococcota bacterium]